MDLVPMIALSVAAIFGLFAIWLFLRNRAVYDAQKLILSAIFIENIFNVAKPGHKERLELYRVLKEHSYNYMMFTRWWVPVSKLEKEALEEFDRRSKLIQKKFSKKE